MLDRHTDLAITPETAFYDEIAPKVIGIKDDRLQRILGGWSRLPELGLQVEEVIEKCERRPTPGQLLQVLLDLYARQRCKPWAGEKTPQHLEHVSSIMNDFPKGVVICIVRDGREVALSLRSMPWWSADLATAAQRWLNAAQLLKRFKIAYPDRFLVVHFENLVTRSVDVLSGIMDFLGLPFQPAQLLPDTPTAVVLARSLEWKGRALAEVQESRATFWRSVADEGELRFLNDFLEVELSCLGYPLS